MPHELQHRFGEQYSQHAPRATAPTPTTTIAGVRVESGITNAHLYTAYRIDATHHAPNPRFSKKISGTGFVLSRDKGGARRFVFVTNRHILDLPWGSRQFNGYRLSGVSIWTHSPRLDGPPELTEPILAAPSIIRFHRDETIDIGGFDLGKGVYAAGAPPVINNFIDESLLASRELLASSIQAGELVFFPGYPAWYDHNGVRPIMRTGAIVSDPRNDYRRRDGEPVPTDGNSQLLFDAFSTSGNSGSPVFVGRRGFRVGEGLNYSGNTREAYLIGINAGHIVDENDQHVGLSRAYKSYEVARFIDSVLKE